MSARPNVDRINLKTCLAIARDALESDPILPEFVARKPATLQIQSATSEVPMTYLVTRGAVTDVTSMAIGFAVSVTDSLDWRVATLKNGKSVLKGVVSTIEIEVMASATLRAGRFLTEAAIQSRLAAKERVIAFCRERGRDGLAKALAHEGVIKKS